MHGQRRIIAGSLLFFSDFDSGNLASAVGLSPWYFELTVSPDASPQNTYKAWFHFGVRGLVRGASYTFVITNLNNLRLFASKTYSPVCRTSPTYNSWQRLATPAGYDGSRLSWSFEVPLNGEDVFFAFAAPYNYGDLLHAMRHFQSTSPCVFIRERLTFTPDGKVVELLTISHRSNFAKEKEDLLPGLFPDNKRLVGLALKPIVFISARVHPGETPASFCLDGLLQALLGKDPRGKALRKKFVFKIVPMVNPDGVSRGHYRVDQFGINLNRCYENPSASSQPSVFAIRSYFVYLSYFRPGILMYLDLHAHASKKDCFLFGNYGKGLFDSQVYAKLMQMNSAFFDYKDCDFSEKSMYTKDAKGQYSKEGSGRVALHRATGLANCVTIECSYESSKARHSLLSLWNSKTGKKHNESYNRMNSVLVPVCNRYFYDEVGSALAYSILDMYDSFYISRLTVSKYRGINGVWDCFVSKKKVKKKKKSLNQIIGRFSNHHQTNENIFVQVIQQRRISLQYRS